MNGSIIYNKYPKVHIGALINYESQLQSLNIWLKNNLFILDDGSPKMKPIEADYMNAAHASSTLNKVCSKFKVNKNDTYQKKVDGQEEDFLIEQSFIMKNVFYTNKPGIRDEDRGDPQRFSIVEQDLKFHPKYEEIKDMVEEIKAQVCGYARKVKGGKEMIADMTILYSRPGGVQQSLHKDENRFTVEKGYVMSAIVATEAGTKLDLGTNLLSTERDTFNICQGSFFLFCGSQVHGGSSYSQPNVRIHFYLHEDQEILDHVTNGIIKIVDKLECEFEGCNYFTDDSTRLRKHYNKRHPGFNRTLRMEKRVIKPAEDGKFYCTADPPCEGMHWPSYNRVWRHYQTDHIDWWEDNKCDGNKRGRKRKNTNE